MKLVRYIALATGQGRRDAMDRIREGRVTVNGEPAESATRDVVPGRDRVVVDGKRARFSGHVHLVMYKPRGVVCTRSDPEGRPTIYDLLKPRHSQAASVGRLDFDTTGVLLFTTDGELAQSLERPSSGARRVYRVKVRGEVTDGALETWRRGFSMDGRRTRPAVVERMSADPRGAIVRVVLQEGMNRQIHRMAEAAGLTAVKIHRTSFAGITAEGLAPGEYRELSSREVDGLLRGGIHPRQAGEVAPGRARPRDHRRRR